MTKILLACILLSTTNSAFADSCLNLMNGKILNTCGKCLTVDVGELKPSDEAKVDGLVTERVQSFRIPASGEVALLSGNYVMKRIVDCH